MKIKKSRVCFCGSGKEFRSCCKGRLNSKMDISNNGLLDNPKQINNMMQQKYKSTDYRTCFHPGECDCKKPIKNAHTLQNNGVLSLISESGNVRVTNILNKILEGTSTKEIRKTNATTFYGFCEYHDSVVFSEIENKPYIKTVEQNLLHAYRTCAQEYHKKNRELNIMQSVFKDNPSIYNMPGFVESYTNRELSYNDVDEYMNIFNEALQCGDSDVLDSYVYAFDNVYDFAVTAMFNPTYDLRGKQLNDIYSQEDERLKSIFVSILPTKECSYMIVSCLKEDSLHFKSYMEQIKYLNEEDLKIFLNNLLPTYSENIVLSPRLWGRWTPFSRKEYERVVCGEIGEFDKLLSGEAPFGTLDEFEDGMFIKNGLNNMLRKAKYNLFKL